jgi:hypothetical protein
MSAHPVRINALPEPDLQTIQEYFKLHGFLTSDGEIESRWLGYIAETEQSLCRVHKQEPSTPALRAAVEISLGFSEEFRKFVVRKGGTKEASKAETYFPIVSAGAGTMINHCSERRKNEGGDIANPR